MSAADRVTGATVYLARTDTSLILRSFVNEGYGVLCAQYVALAQCLNALLITEDRKLRNAVPEIALSMRKFLAQ